MIVRKILFFFLFLFIVGFLKSQDFTRIESLINYQLLKNEKDNSIDNKFFYHPKKGYYDVDAFMPFYQCNFTYGYELLNFQFEEELLPSKDQAFYKNKIFNTQYKISQREQVNNSNKKI